MQLINQHKKAVAELCQQFHVKQLYVFGSALTDAFHERSDIDMVVELEPMDYASYSSNYFGLKFALEALLQRPIDLLEEKAIKNPIFRKHLLNTRHSLYGHSGKKLAI